MIFNNLGDKNGSSLATALQPQWNTASHFLKKTALDVGGYSIFTLPLQLNNLAIQQFGYLCCLW